MGKMYIDDRGWKYKVMGGIGGKYKIRFQTDRQSGDVGWKGYPVIPWRDTLEDAEADLEDQAKKRGWKLVE